jgi:hypothetical protein
MPKVKGTDIVSLRKLFENRGEALEKQFLSHLSESLETIYIIATVHSWLPVEIVGILYQKASLILYSEDENPLRRLGQEMSKHSYSTIYKLFLRIPTVPFLMNVGARIWRTYYDKGGFRIEKKGPKELMIAVLDFSEWPEPMRIAAEGHYITLLEYTGVKNIRIVETNSHPECWTWRVTWE